MPRVRVRHAHINLGTGTRSFGDVEDITAEAAEYLIASGAVELVRDVGADTPERASAPERTARPELVKSSAGGGGRIQRRG